MPKRKPWEIREKPVPKRYETVYTTAPESYDSFGSKTTQAMAGYWRRSSGEKEVVRKVRVHAEHAEWQIGRYTSGLYFTRDAKNWRIECEAGTAGEYNHLGL